MTINSLDFLIDFNTYLALRLQPGEKVCNKCQGCGDDLNSYDFDGYCKPCSKCNGEGKVTWIQDMFDK